MDVDRWRRVQELFDAAADLPAAEQRRFLARECGADEPLRREVEALLRSDVEAGTFIEQAIRRGSDLLLADQPEALEAIGKIGKYEILGRIGEGGFGIVYKGRDPLLQRYVAVKTCSSSDEKLRRRFFREGQIAAGLQHPNITTVHDLGVERGVPYLVQEFLEGEDLHFKIARREALTALQRLDLLAQVARGLEYAHDQGVLHRDIKPANIRSLPSGAVKIMDFGIAKLLHEVSDVTTQGVTLGTVGYLAPEQLRGGEVDRRTDIFSFGVLVYEVMAYERPFKGKTFSEVSYRLLNEEPKSLGELAPVSAAVAGLAARCLAKDPAARPESFAEVLAVLDPEIEALRSGAFVVMAAGDEGGGAGGAGVAAAVGEGLPAARARTGVAARWARRRTAMGGIAAAGVMVAAMAGSRWLTTRRPAGAAGPAVAAAAPVLARATPVPAPAAHVQAPAAADPAPVARDRGPAGGAAAPLPGARVPRISDLPQAGRRPVPPALVEGGAGGGSAAAAAMADSLPFERPVGPRGPGAMAGGPAPAAGPTGGGAAAGGAGGAQVGAAGAGAAGGSAGEPASGVVGGVGGAGGSGPGGAAEGSAAAGQKAMVRGDLILPGAAGAVPPRLVSRPEPKYPDRARRRQMEADVMILVLVDETGHVVQAIVKGTDDPGLGFNQAARLAAMQAVFEPARRQGVAGKMWTELPFSFRLRGAAGSS